MKALTLQQPWASLVLGHGKSVENRSWSTRYRGPLLIHAGQGVDRDAMRWWSHTLQLDELPRGGIIARVQLVDVVTDTDGEWAMPGEYHWILADVQPIEFTACRGKLGLWDYQSHREPVPTPFRAAA